MKYDDRLALKGIICHCTHCRDCTFYPSCNWREATDRTLILLALKSIKDAKPEEKKTLVEYAQATGVAKYLVLKAVII